MAKKKMQMAVVETANSTEDYIIKGAGAVPPSAKRLNLPRLVKMAEVPIGATVSGKLVAIVGNITGRDDMREARLLHLENKGIEFLFPMTGVIRKALEPDDSKKAETYVGRTLYFTRQADGTSGKFKKAMFMFDVCVGN